MSKIDCSKTVNFFKERVRMCETHKSNCYDCLIYKATLNYDKTCSNFIKLYTEEAVEIVQKWSDEHPQKTRLDDLLEKYPNANADNVVKNICVKTLGYKKEDCGFSRCEDCWDMPL